MGPLRLRASNDSELRSNPQCVVRWGLRALPGSHTLAENNTDLRPFACTGNLRRRGTVRDNLQVTHAAQNPEHFSRGSLSIIAADLGDLSISNHDLERRFACE